MLPRFHWSDLTTVGHYLGTLIFLTGVLMCIPALIASLFGEMRQLVAFIVGIGVCIALGSLLRLLKSTGLDRRRSLLLVGFSWVIVGTVAAVPMLLSGEFDSLFDAVFDSVSALTTTGVSLANDVDSLGYSQITWRVLLTFVGAHAVILIAMYFGFFGEGSKAFVMNERRGQRKRPRISETWILIIRVSTVFILIGAVAATAICITLGMSPVDAVLNGFWLTVNAVSTGGFVPHGSELMYYHSLPLELLVSGLMIVGALSFAVIVYLRNSEYSVVLKNFELRIYMLWLVFLVIFATYSMTREGVFTTLEGLVSNGMFTVLSVATTCGMQTVYPQQIGGAISDGVLILLCVAAMFGACAYSTGGGIKIVRILQVLRWIGYSILRHLAPERAQVRMKYEHFGSRVLNSRDAMLAMTVFIMYLVTAAIGSMIFIAYNPNNALNSVLEVISYVSNCGFMAGITQPDMPFVLKITALLLMWLGRVEFISLIAALVGIVISLLPSNLFSNNRSRKLREDKEKNKGGTAWRRRKHQGSGSRVGVLLVVVACAGVVCVGVPSAGAVASDTNGAEVSAQELGTLSTVDAYRDISIDSLLKATSRQDGKDIRIEGRAMGEPIYADSEHTWVNLKSENAMIGVYMDDELASRVGQYGSYGREGDTVSVEGAYHYACAEHNGEMDVHAESIEITQSGSVYEVPWSPALLGIGLLLFAVGVGLTVLRGFLHRSARRIFDL